MRVQVLGPVRAWHGGSELSLGTPRQRALLGLLALATGRGVGRAELIASLWPAGPPSSATNVIHTYVKRLRQIVDPGRRPRGPSRVLPAVGDGYALAVRPGMVDVDRFRQRTAEATNATSSGRHQLAATLWDEALRMWQAERPLSDVDGLTDHPRLRALMAERMAALGRYGDALIAAGRAVDALAALREAADAQPLDEAAQARLVLAYHAAGQRGRAFDTYHAARRRLADELGVDPGEQLLAAHRLLLGVSRASSRPAVVPRTVPHQLPADVPPFVGRSAELSELDSHSAGSPATVVVCGPAGVGKTAIAVRWAHRARNRFVDGLLHLDLRGNDSGRPLPAGEALDRLLRRLGVPAEEIPLDIDGRSARLRCATFGRRLLILLENAAGAEQVIPLLPGAGDTVVLVTSRDRMAALVARHGAHRLTLGRLSLADSVDLLTRLIGPSAEDDPAAVAELAERCARLPLTLRVAAERAAARPATPLVALRTRERPVTTHEARR